MRALNYGRPIYRHSSRFSNSTLKSMAFIGSLSLFLCGVFFSINFQRSVTSFQSGGWFDPITWLFLLAGVTIFLTMVLFPYLINPTNFMITTTGVQTSYSRISRLLKGHPIFVEFKDIETIFPHFIPGLPLPDGTKGEDILYSLVIILKNGRRVEMKWISITLQTPTSKMRFLDMFLCFPEELREKWSDIPIPTKEEERLSRLMDKKGSEDIVTYRIIIFGIVTIIALVVLILNFVLETVLNLKALWLNLIFFSSILLLISSAISLGIFIAIDVNRIAKVQVNRRLFREREKGNIIHIMDGRWASRNELDEAFFKPIREDEVRNSMNAIDRFNPVINRIFASIGISFIIASFLFFFFSEELFPIYMELNIIIPFILGFLGIVCLGLGFAVFGKISIKRHLYKIDAAIADEVRTGKEILPKGYVLPEWFLLNRGPKPLTNHDIGKIKKWSRFKIGQRVLIVICLIMGGYFFSVVLFLFRSVLPLSEMIIWISLSTEVITIPLGIWFIVNTITALRNLDRIVRWEKRSGVRILPDDLRKRWLDWIVEEGSGQ